MKSSTWHSEQASLLLMTGGFFVHLISASRHLEDDAPRVGDILLRSREFALTYDVSTALRKVGYWASASTTSP